MSFIIDPPYLDLVATALRLYVDAIENDPATFGEPDWDDASCLLERVREAMAQSGSTPQSEMSDG